MTLKAAPESDTPSGSAAEAAQMAIEAGLVYVSDTEPGIRRFRVGKGFRYVTPENRRLAAEKDLKRIASLAIPPAYRDVWITLKPRGHLQATGRDARGRKLAIHADARMHVVSHDAHGVAVGSFARLANAVGQGRSSQGVEHRRA